MNIYGSHATGLNIPLSDIDINFCNFDYMFSYQKLFQDLIHNLAFFKWVIKPNLILTARIPVLKLEIDPSIDFMEFSYANPPINFLNFYSKYPEFNLKEKSKKVFKIDITLFYPSEIVSFPNIGYISTSFIKNKLEIYSPLKKISLFIKFLLYNKNFNNSYQG